MFSDDMHDVLLDIGFTFNFYGIAYTQLVVSGNGYITFDTTQANQYSPYAINNSIPNPGSMPENAIMAPWHDINVATGGEIYYGMIGIAPNRRFIVTWCEVPMFSCSSDLHTSQVVLYEGSDKIEMYLQDKPLCVGWNSGAAIQGLVDETSTNFDIVVDPLLLADRNFPLQWTATNEGWEFIPNSPATSYTISSIPYVPIITGQNTWTDASGNILAVGPTLPVNISSTNVYYANITGSCASGMLGDSIEIIVTGCFDIDLSSNPASCLGNDANILCTPDTLLPLWDAELLDMNGNSLSLITNIVATSYTFTDLFPGTYVVNAAAGISNSQDTIVVGQIQNPMNITSYTSNVNCFNGDDGKISINASGGLLPYTYYIDGILNSNAYPLDSVFYNLSGGLYIVSVMDHNFCLIRDTVIIETPSHKLQALVASKVVVCNNSSDSFCVGSAAGGTPGYSYEWFDSGMTSFSTNDTAFGLSAGSYYLKVMDANGCDTITTVNVIGPQTPLTSSPELFNVSCKGDNTGMIVGDASGSWSPYTYYWLDMQGDTLQQSAFGISTRDTLFNLIAGSYQLHIEDFQGCRSESVFNILEPQDALSIDSMDVISDIACYGDSVGSARLYISGGDPTYTYLWDNGEIGIIASALTSGYHSVVLTDDWGCNVIDSIFISENTLIESNLVVDTTVSCYGENDGIASISTIGGASLLYTYFWSNGQQITGVNADTASGLSQGSYSVITRDVLGCEVIDTVYISQPEPLSMEAAELDWIDCFGDSNGLAFSTAQGGTTPYLFSWDNGQWTGDTVGTLTFGFHTVVVTDIRGCTASDTVFTHEPTELYINIDTSQTILPYCTGVNTASLTAISGGGTPGYTYEWDDNPVQPQTTLTATALLAGFYTITVTDSKGCISSDTITINNTNTMDASTSSLTTYIGGNGVSCFGSSDGQALVEASGAHAPYSYAWSGPNGYVSTNDTIFNLSSGVYSVAVRDTNNCMVNRQIIITEPMQLEFATLVATGESCLGACDGEVQVSVTGGIFPYMAIATETTTSNVITSLMTNDSIVTGLCSGTYTFTFTDANGCSSILIASGLNQQNISADVATVAEIDTSSIANILCNGLATGSLEVLNPTVGFGYNYSWQDINGNVISMDTIVSNLLAGTYVLYAGYNNIAGCTSTDTATLTELPIINASAVIDDVDCFGSNDGSIDLLVNGGSGGSYTYLWSDGSTNEDLTGLSSGTYSITVTDTNNCEESFTFDVNEPDALVASITQNGYILTASVPTGGIAPYSYSWMEQSSTINPPATGLTYVVDTYGTYYVDITDANGCQATSNTFTYENPNSITDLDVLNLLSIYPNPFKEETTIDFGVRMQEVSIRLVDVFGKLIEQYDLRDIDKYIIKRDNKASGIYFIEIEINQQYYNNIKLIID